MAKMVTAEQIDRMKKLRGEGLSYKSISEAVGCSDRTVKNWLIPGEREKQRERSRKNREKNPEYKIKWRTDNPNYYREYYEKNKEAEKERSRKYYIANTEAVKLRTNKWVEENRERYSETYRRYYKNNREARREFGRKYHIKNKEAINKRHRDRYKYNQEHGIFRRCANPEERIAYMREWRKNNREKTLASNAAYRALKAEATVGDLSEIQAIYDCAANNPDVMCYLHLDGCPYADGEKISVGDRHVDHVIPLSRGGMHTASNLAISCSRCNLSKGTKLLEELEELDDIRQN